MTPDELEAIKARCEAATPGPWQVHEERLALSEIGKARGKNPEWVPLQRSIHTTWDHPQLIDPAPVVTTATGPFHEPSTSLYISQENASFIAAARTDVPRLVAEVERLRAENERLLAVAKAAKRVMNEILDGPTLSQADNELSDALDAL